MRNVFRDRQSALLAKRIHELDGRQGGGSKVLLCLKGVKEGAPQGW